MFFGYCIRLILYDIKGVFMVVFMLISTIVLNLVCVILNAYVDNDFTAGVHFGIAGAFFIGLLCYIL